MIIKNIIFVIITALIIGCGGGEVGGSKKNRFITITKKDTLTSPEQGGYGFKEVAEGLGYQTYIWSEERDSTFFGDP